MLAREYLSMKLYSLSLHGRVTAIQVAINKIYPFSDSDYIFPDSLQVGCAVGRVVFLTSIFIALSGSFESSSVRERWLIGTTVGRVKLTV
jgi:hypothetical protein